MVQFLCVPIMLIVVVAACSPEPPSSTEPKTDAAAPVVNASPSAPVAPPTIAAPVLAIDGEGLRLFNPATGSARPITFGTTRVTTLSSLAFRGEPKFARLEECGAGPLDQAAWSDGLRVYFQDGKFAGWALDARVNDGTIRPAITTASGIGPGSTRAELQDAYSARVMQSTLGTEFTAGDLAGLLDGAGPRARITNLWAGASCNFR